MDCPSDRQLRKFKVGELSPQEHAPLAEHVAGCGLCRGRLEQEPTEQGVSTMLGTSPTVQVDQDLYREVTAHEATASGFGPFESAGGDDAVEEIQSAETLGPGDEWQGVTVGSYRFLQPLWTLEPCELYSAQETLSHRQLTVRILELQGDWSSSKAAKLLADARVLSDLRHPGIPRVHEIVLQDGRAFVAMDPEEGVSLEEWLTLSQRSQRERVKVFMGAANALAVLHGAGLVHGDFTPAAVRITPDGSVRLANLSLMRPPVGNEGLSLRYSPPDPLDTHELDVRSEQYSFCAVFFEAMTGVLPYVEQISDGQARRIPGWLRPIFQRGLNRDRADRYESMRHLAQELRRNWRQRERLKPLLYGAVGLSALLVLGIGARMVLRRDGSAAATATTSCVDSHKRIELAWNEKRKEEVRRGLQASKRPFSSKTADGVVDALEAYTQSWDNSFRAVCGAPTQRGAAAIRLCLEQRMLDLEALTSVLTQAEPRVAIRALDAARSLPDPTECAGGPMAGRKVPENASKAWTTAVIEGMEHLSKARAFAETDQPWRAPMELARAAELAQQAPDAWLSAETLVLQGTLKARQADAPNAEKVLRRALLEAQGAGHPLASARAAGQLGYVYGVLMGRAAEADRAFEQAFALSSYVSDDALTARLLLIRATVYENLREPEKALEDAERALALLKGRGAGTEHAQAAALNAMGRTAAATGKTDDALVHQQAALGLLERSLGPNHPEVARALEALALVHLGRKEANRALPLLERSTALRDSALGAEDPSFGSSLRVLCELYRTQRDWDKAEECLARAVAVEEKRQSDASLVPALLELARVHEAQEKPQLALVSYQKAALLSERLLGTSQPTVATALRGMASAYLDLRQPEKARQALERSVMLVEPSGVDLEPVVRLRVQLTRVLKGPAARAMAFKAREDAERCGGPCAALLHELDGGAARTPSGPNVGGSRFPSRR